MVVLVVKYTEPHRVLGHQAGVREHDIVERIVVALQLLLQRLNNLAIRRAGREVVLGGDVLAQNFADQLGQRGAVVLSSHG